MNLVSVKNNSQRIFSLPHGIELNPGMNNVESARLAKVKEMELVKFLFDSKELEIVGGKKAANERD